MPSAVVAPLASVIDPADGVDLVGHDHLHVRQAHRRSARRDASIGDIASVELDESP